MDEFQNQRMNKHFGSRPIRYLICGKNIHDTGDVSVHQGSVPGFWPIQIQTQYRFDQRDPKRAEMLGALGVWKHFGFGGSSREFVSCKVWEAKGLGKEAIAALPFDLFCLDLIDIWLFVPLHVNNLKQIRTAPWFVWEKDSRFILNSLSTPMARGSTCPSIPSNAREHGERERESILWRLESHLLKDALFGSSDWVPQTGLVWP